LNKLKAGSEISKFTGVSSADKSWTEGFHRLPGDLNDQQRIRSLRAQVHGTAGRVLDQVLDGDAYENAADDATRIAILQQALDGTYDTPELREGFKDSLKNCVQGPKEHIEDYLHRWEEAHSRTALDYDEGQKIYKFKKGLNRELATKVDASLRRFNSVIEMVNALAPFDRNRRSGDPSYISLHESHQDNLLTVLISEILGLKKNLAELKPKHDEDVDGSYPPAPRRFPGNGRGRGRGSNPNRYAHVQCHNCGEYGHIVRTCPQLYQDQGRYTPY